MSTKIRSIKDKDYVGDLRHHVCKASIIELAVYAYNSQLPHNSDSENDKTMKKEWLPLVTPIFDAIDVLYKMQQELDMHYDVVTKAKGDSKLTFEKKRDFELIDYALCGPWNWSYPWKLTFRQVRKGRYTILLMKKLIERLRDAHTWVDNGGTSEKDWAFQRDLSNKFAGLLKLLGRYSIKREQKTEQDDKGTERTRTVTYRVEPIITQMEQIKNKYHPFVPREDDTIKTKKNVGSNGKSNKKNAEKHK
uniref:Uncharacterized protein n=1 Tax=Mimivirus LCMiAC01 TaxID=2506608 RepID=A0A481YYL0_9VIRU|nr:MAG: hypothetical protein LCMiAC01_00070 [Mimivirus LCMiAC01]